MCKHQIIGFQVNDRVVVNQKKYGLPPLPPGSAGYGESNRFPG